jgi:hypothetical protein
MIQTDFFKLDQVQWFFEFQEQELPKNLPYTEAHDEKFVFEDIPF